MSEPKTLLEALAKSAPRAGHMIGECWECKHWAKIPYSDVGDCQRIYSVEIKSEREPHQASLLVSSTAKFQTTSGFGCILWSKKHE